MQNASILLVKLSFYLSTLLPFFFLSSFRAGFAASLQDRFLIMAAEMDQSSGAGVPELTQFWKEVPRTKVMEHR